MEGTTNGSENKKGSSGERRHQVCAPDGGQGSQGTEGSQGCGNWSSVRSRTPYSGRQVHQDHLQPNWRERMPPLRRHDVEGARCLHGEARERRRPGTLRSAYGVGRIQGVKPLFTLGHVVATPGALAALEKAGQQPGDFLARHVSGDWGEVPPEDMKENELSLQHGFRLLSAYRTTAGDKVWVITEADRSSTCILLPEEY